MSDAPSAVHAAIDRWEEAGLVSPELAARLRADTEEDAAEGSRRLSQYVIAGTAATVLLLAGGLFLDWAWPRMGVEARAGVDQDGDGVIVRLQELWGRRAENVAVSFAAAIDSGASWYQPATQCAGSSPTGASSGRSRTHLFGTTAGSPRTVICTVSAASLRAATTVRSPFMRLRELMRRRTSPSGRSVKPSSIACCRKAAPCSRQTLKTMKHWLI